MSAHSYHRITELEGDIDVYFMLTLLQEAMDNSAERPVPLIDAFFSGHPVPRILATSQPVLLEAYDLAYRQAEQHILAWGGMPALLPLSDTERWEWLKTKTMDIPIWNATWLIWPAWMT